MVVAAACCGEASVEETSLSRDAREQLSPSVVGTVHRVVLTVLVVLPLDLLTIVDCCAFCLTVQGFTDTAVLPSDSGDAVTK